MLVPGQASFRTCRRIVIEASLTQEALIVTGQVLPRYTDDPVIDIQRTLPGPFAAAKANNTDNGCRF